MYANREESKIRSTDGILKSKKYLNSFLHTNIEWNEKTTTTLTLSLRETPRDIGVHLTLRREGPIRTILPRSRDSTRGLDQVRPESQSNLSDGVSVSYRPLVPSVRGGRLKPNSLPVPEDFNLRYERNHHISFRS